MSPISKAIAWILLSSALFVAVTGAVRHLGSEMNAFQAAFIRYFIGSLFFISVYVRLIRAGRYPGEGKFARPSRGRTWDWRHALAMQWRVYRSPMSRHRVYGTHFHHPSAALFLGERLQRRRITVVLVGFVGTIMIYVPALKPSP